MQHWLIVEYLARGDTARWQTVSHLGSHGVPAAPVRYETEVAARPTMDDLAQSGLATRLVRVWPDGSRDVLIVGRSGMALARPEPLETKTGQV